MMSVDRQTLNGMTNPKADLFQYFSVVLLLNELNIKL